ncbi:MAG TPA: TetR/AcrR family transcriptional regulator [Candidatus Acidoferrum sp.]|nr:TetR/AcrR family transcriptional regulator [Candidatus Acidoferrum sp.]
MIRARKNIARKEVRPPGRPRAFDPEKALERALRVFWERGYEGASLAGLTRAMKINRPSMYAAFGNKEQLFRKVLDRYAQEVGSHVHDGLREATARGAIEKILFDSAEALVSTGHPRGCLLVQGALACGAESRGIQRELCARRGAGEALIRQRLERAKVEGDLAAEADPAELASFVATVLNGMSVQAAGGADAKKLRGIAERAMQAWPS